MTKNIKFALFGNVYQEHKCSAVQSFFDIAKKRHADIAVYQPFYKFLLTIPHINWPECKVITDCNFTADYVVCIGGDGTFLDTASKVAHKNIPIVGINAGRLGFLASFSPESIVDTISNICDGHFKTQSHSVLQMTCDDATINGYPYALNEIAILKHDISSMITIHTNVNGEHITTYQADGLIISTPTGSTAYSLSVGGPIIVPQSDTICLTPVAPHSLNMRPIVLCDNSEITLTVESRSNSFLISFDGRSQSYPDNIQLHISKAPYNINVVIAEDQSFFSTLRRKMMWGADKRGH